MGSDVNTLLGKGEYLLDKVRIFRGLEITPHKSKVTEPEIVQMPAQNMAALSGLWLTSFPKQWGRHKDVQVGKELIGLQQ